VSRISPKVCVSSSLFVCPVHQVMSHFTRTPEAASRFQTLDGEIACTMHSEIFRTRIPTCYDVSPDSMASSPTHAFYCTFAHTSLARPRSWAPGKFDKLTSQHVMRHALTEAYAFYALGVLFSIIGGRCKRYAVALTLMPGHNCLLGRHSPASARRAAI
jgi:hypothetical protein